MVQLSIYKEIQVASYSVALEYFAELTVDQLY